jgi:hypothetical protein
MLICAGVSGLARVARISYKSCSHASWVAEIKNLAQVVMEAIKPLVSLRLAAHRARQLRSQDF